MNETSPYENLSLDEIIEITGSDARHAPQLREQGKGLKALAEKLDESVEAMLVARGVVESGFEGVAAGTLHEQATQLVSRGSEGHAELRDQPGIFFTLSDQAELTHQRMVELRDERDKKMEKAPAGERSAIREDYTHQARQYMRETTSGYVKALRRSDWMKGYTGPRLPRDGEANGPKGFVDRNTPGPALGQSGADTGPQLQSGVALAPDSFHSTNSAQAQSVLKGQSWVGAGTVGFGPSTIRNSKNSKKKKKRDRENGSGIEPVKRDVLPPVIGGRGEPEMAAASDPAPRSDGLVQPVIGGREAGQPGETREPLPRHDGLLPPVIGGRTMPTAGPRTIANPAAPTPAPAPEPQRRRFTASAAGVRAVRPDYPAEGKVIRGGTGTPVPAPGPEPAAEPGYTREAESVPVRPDDPDHAAVRNSRVFAEPQDTRSQAPETTRARRWQRTPEEPEFETGPFITNYNLGRSQ